MERLAFFFEGFSDFNLPNDKYCIPKYNKKEYTMAALWN